jgi:hypothetical protein
MPKPYGITAEDRDEARATAGRPVEEGAFEGWAEALSAVVVEEIAEGVS